MDFNVNKYAKLAQIKLTKAEEDKFQKDLNNIIAHIDELKKVNVDNVTPMTGGTNLKNVFRKDEAVKDAIFDPKFPVEENDYLKVPRILNND